MENWLSYQSLFRCCLFLFLSLTSISSVHANDAEIPDYIKSKKMSKEDLEKKREGTFITAFPDISSDPLTGLGFGLKSNVFWNGIKEDGTFPYTPYLTKLSLGLKYYETNAKSLSASLDIPYFNQSRWRLRIDGKLNEDPTNLYFGITEKTLQPLSLSHGRTRIVESNTFKEYEKERQLIRPGFNNEFPYVSDVYSNQYKENNYLLNPKTDYAFGNGKWRIMGGYEIQKLSYSTFTGRNGEAIDPKTGLRLTAPSGESLLSREAKEGKIIGIEGGWISILQTALIYDSRDFEPDPTSGIYFELTNEYSSRSIGSAYNFNKTFIQLRSYYRLPWGKRTVIANRFGFGNIFGKDAPFFEFMDQWSPEGSINALGGGQSLRGYRSNRFVARSMVFNNFEVRYRLFDFHFNKQYFGLSLALLYDLGTVRDKMSKYSFENFKESNGFGFRLAWNLSTMISLDFGFSSEDRLMYLGMGQVF